MTTSIDFKHFATNIISNNYKEVDKAIACLWFIDYKYTDTEMCVKELATIMQDVGLANNINVSRLSKNLKKSKYTVKGKDCSSYRISPTRKLELDEKYESLLKRRKTKVSDDFLPQSVIPQDKKNLVEISYQINGCYDNGFFDGCAVLCRRMIESLLIGVFEKEGSISAIQNSDGSLRMLDYIIKQIKSGKYFRLPRNAPKTIDKIKEIGDTAAHDRYHITTKQDMEEFRSSFRRVISQLIGMSQI